MLAMQFHVEADVDTIRHWAIDLSDKHPVANESVQTGKQIINASGSNFEISRELAKQLYTKWSEYLN